MEALQGFVHNAVFMVMYAFFGIRRHWLSSISITTVTDAGPTAVPHQYYYPSLLIMLVVIHDESLAITVRIYASAFIRIRKYSVLDA